ncbi:MAG: DUF1499 domain-containing protein [Rhodospirillaceae bacterium]|nr:DUF1499 domain-containing protein [Rhodospirillaceae bacterium]
MAKAYAAGARFTEKYAAKVCSIGLTIVGLGALVAALSGPLYQAGIVGLVPAFDVLRYAVYALGAGAALCVIGFVFGLIAFKSDVLSNAANGLLGIIIAGAVFLVPYSQMSRNAPPIHEITTDFDNPPAFIDIVPLREATNAANPPQYVPVIKGFGREVDVMQMQKDVYGDIQPLRFKGTNYEAVFEKALQGVEDMNWTLVSANPQLGRIEAYDKTAWFGFIDDVVIRVEAQPMAYEIDIRSKSRVGFGDIGANAERVRKYLRSVSGVSAH